jgi:hypothetical protein
MYRPVNGELTGAVVDGDTATVVRDAPGTVEVVGTVPTTVVTVVVIVGFTSLAGWEQPASRSVTITRDRATMP